VRAFFLTLLLLLPRTARGDEPRAEMGVAMRASQRAFALDTVGRGHGYGVSVSQHAHFGRMFGTEVGVGFSTGTTARGWYRTDLEWVMPAFVLRIPTEGEIQPYVSSGFVMTGSWFSAPNVDTVGFMYAGNQTALGVEWRSSKKVAWLFELGATIRGRFTVEKKDLPTLAANPDFANGTRVVHETYFTIGMVLFGNP
jgi:hypothetical protein